MHTHRSAVEGIGKGHDGQLRTSGCLIDQWRVQFLLCGGRPASLSSLWKKKQIEIDGLVQDCSNSIANALELLQSCTMLPESFLHIDTQIQSEIPLNNNVQEIRRSSDKPSNWGRQPPGI